MTILEEAAGFDAVTGTYASSSGSVGSVGYTGGTGGGSGSGSGSGSGGGGIVTTHNTTEEE